MRWLPLLRRTPKPTRRDALAAAGVRTESDAEYRRARMDSYIRLMGDSSHTKVAELEAFLDSWVLSKTVDGFVAHPLWDDEPLLTRENFPNREAAEAAVADVGGVLQLVRRA